MTARALLALLLCVLVAALVGCPTSRPSGDDDDSAAADDDDAATDDDDNADDTSIADVQDGTVPVGTLVTLVDVVVTAIPEAAYGLYVSEPDGGPWSGIWCYTGNGADGEPIAAAFVVGDGVTITGVTEEYDSNGAWDDTVTELDFTLSDESSLLPGNNVSMPAPTVVPVTDLTSAATAEQYEGVLVRIEDVSVLTAPDDHGEWTVTGDVSIDDQLFVYEATVGEGFSSITGVLNYSWGAYKIEPRDAADLVAAR